MPDIRVYEQIGRPLTLVDVEPYVDEIIPEIVRSYDGLTVVLTDERLFDAIELEMIRGQFWTREDVETGASVAVVSEHFCLERSMTTDIVGERIQIGHDFYTISGVFACSDDFVSSAAGYDLSHYVYIPCTSVHTAYTETITRFYTQEELSEEMKILCYTYEETNVQKLKNDFNRGFAAFGVITVMFLCFLLRNKISKPGRKIICVIAFVLGFVVLLSLWRIPTEYLPPSENLFDFSHYLEAFARDMRKILAGELGVWERMWVVREGSQMLLGLSCWLLVVTYKEIV